MTALTVRSIVRLRAIASLVIGAGVGVATAFPLGPAAGVLAGWGTFALVNVVWVLCLVWPMGPTETHDHATIEAPGRRAARLISIVGSLVSLAAVLSVIVQAQHEPGIGEYVLAGIAVVSVATSWLLIQVDYVLRYARMYYADPRGGIDFNQEETPQYTDFVYFSLGLGMTYQVADTNVTTNAIRRVVIAQTALAYLFGTVILATIINLVTGLG
ncbi:DUF1345 domain-containing protein [Microbacterium aurantiacum]|uniref:DUF1345 domain-containing protein n=1 Tax=Microbacterium aurantiacum TaxID=162393 RepID=UPI000C7FC27E|nr:DUF1345 domain-containing protein [Microbacterium aurantiacum]